jgi:hypothetical protein
MKLALTQKGAVAIVVALSLIALVGAVGIAIDTGRLFVTKSELQNAADACALSAARELTTTPLSLADFTRAENAGITVGQKHKRDFQHDDATLTVDQSVTFSDTLDGIYAVKGSAPSNSKYVRCTIERTGIVPWFMQLLQAGSHTVAATAVATLAPSQSNCAIPMGLCGCVAAGAPNFGLTQGQWYQTVYDQGGSTPSTMGSCPGGNPTGNFNWIDFNPSSVTAGCSGGGAAELACIIGGSGECNLPPVGPSTCPSGSNPPAGCVGATGAQSSLSNKYNTRFGIYQGGAPGGTVSPSELTANTPDYTGKSYQTSNWSAGSNAYSGTSPGEVNFQSARSTYTKNTDNFKGGSSREASSAQHQQYGADRRVAVVPIVNCPLYTPGQTVPILGYACVLLLNPIINNGDVVRIEYLGAPSVAGNPCATSGAVGSSASSGPLVPALVQ